MENQIEKRESANDKEYEPGNEFDTTTTTQQEPLNDDSRRFLSKEEYDMMDIVSHNNAATVVLDFNKDLSKIMRVKHIFDKEKGPVPIDYFPVTLPKDPDYQRYYKVTSRQLMKNIIKRYLAKDKTRLEITRMGSGKSTIYKLRAVQDDKMLVIPTTGETYFESVQQQKTMAA